MKKIMLASLLVLLSLNFTGCTSAQIQNVPEQSIAANKSNLTDKDVFTAIQRAGTQLGWIVKKVNNNTAIATLNLRKHNAVVTIKFNTKNYSIKYKSSANIGYNKKNNTIHKNYNGWIQNLDNAIQAQLSSL